MLLSQTHHPWPLPAKPWALHMAWEDLLFAHWQTPAARLRELLPPGLELDLFEGEAWIGIVPFRMRETAARGLPAIPGTSSFLELNVRTYVRAGDKPGVWFFSLDASSRLAVRGARALFHLPYFDARMRCEAGADGICYASQRTHRGASSATFEARYRPVGSVFASRPESLESWLTDRYCLYAVDRRDQLYRGEIHHARWPLQRAEAEFPINKMTEGLGIELAPEDPHLLFARRLEVVAWPLERVGAFA